MKQSLDKKLLAFASEKAVSWRQQLHKIPETSYEEFQTSTFLLKKLSEFGIKEITKGIAKTGIIASIPGKARKANRHGNLVFRAELDGLPIKEQNAFDYRSRNNCMHACGHDGHMAILLGLAYYLTHSSGAPDSNVILCFQPAEEGGAGAKSMLDQGVFENSNIRRIYSLHNRPNVSASDFIIQEGTILAGVDTFEMVIEGSGGHAARPHETVSPIPVACKIVERIQSLSKSELVNQDEVVISVTKIHSGSAYNVIPNIAIIGGTIRAFNQSIFEIIRSQLSDLAENFSNKNNVKITIKFDKTPYPPLNNEKHSIALARAVAKECGFNVLALDNFRSFGGEDFAFFLEQYSGALILIGNGKSKPLHHPEYDFNDSIVKSGIEFLLKLIDMDSIILKSR